MNPKALRVVERLDRLLRPGRGRSALREQALRHIRAFLGLKENAEVLANHFGYGAWILPHGEMVHVHAPGGHQEEVERRAKQHGIEPDPEIMDRENRWRIPALRKGWVRVVTRTNPVVIQAHKFTPQSRATAETLSHVMHAAGKRVQIDNFGARSSATLDPTKPHEVKHKLRNVFRSAEEE